MAAGDPLLGGATPGVVNRQQAPPPSPTAATRPSPLLAQPTAQAVPPLPPISSTASNAALAGGQPLDGGRDLRIADPRATADGRTWQPQAAAGGASPNLIPGAPANQQDSVYARSFGPAVSARVGSYEQAQAYLASRGVNWQRLETFGDQGEWKFSCSIPNPQNRLISRTYEARARDYLSAIRAVIDQISRE